MKEYTIETPTDTEPLQQWLEEKIYEYNSGSIGRDDGRLFSRVIKNEAGEVVAAVAGWTWANACEITQLWVDERLRASGLGTQLLKAAEAEAVSKGCRTILIKTYSFQAPNFYQRYGYTIRQTLNDFPAGHTYYMLTKTIG